MTRPIKFRVWDKILGRYIPFSSFLSFDSPEYVFQQYTGLEDKEGREVYEGDIVSWSEYQGWEDGRTFCGYYEVRWNEGALRFDFYDPFDSYWWELNNTRFDNVVGNIFENPNLIKAK